MKMKSCPTHDELEARSDQLRQLNWEPTLEWLRAHPDAEPGGVGSVNELGELEPVPDLFDVPLPEGFDPGDGEWEGRPLWGDRGVGIEWVTPAGVSFALPFGREPCIILPDGTIIV